MENHNQIEDDAAEWLARRDSGQWSDDDESRLEQWIQKSTAHRIAYLRLKFTWDTAARLRTLRAGTSPSTLSAVPPPGEWQRSPFFDQSSVPASAPGSQRWRLNRNFAVAASILLVVAASFLVYHWGGSGDRYTTSIGGLTSVPMTDGSKITLNTNSIVRVVMTENERQVQLDRGEAFFDVAKDPARPFVVRANQQRIIAVGTKFSVQQVEDEVRVIVTEGKVRIETAQSAPVLISAGSIARTSKMGVAVQEAESTNVDEFLSWREGYLTFHETALEDAVTEINRYNHRKIFIGDPKLSAIRISGTFRPTQYEAFVRVLRDGFSIHARNEGEHITLTPGS